MSEKTGQKSDISGYFYTDSYDYIYLVTDGSEQNYKFIFKNEKIYDGDENKECDSSEFIGVIKKITSEFRNKILEHQAELETYEKIYTNRKDYTKFIKKHSILKYEIRKFQNKISHFYEALVICQTEQPALKKQLKNYTYEAGLFKNVVTEYAPTDEDIYAHIQGIKNDKINRNIYILTMISALLLPLNFITSFFGMNTSGLFLSEYKNATTIVSAFMLVTLIILAICFWLYDKKQE
mgnify:FL=1